VRASAASTRRTFSWHAAQHPPHSGEFLDYAAAAGIPLTIRENRYPMPGHFRTRTNRTTRDTHEAAS
jgi:hypothetical protein